MSGEEEKKMETKPGPQTTEFWITLLTNLLGVAQLVGLDPYQLGNSSNKYVVGSLALLNGLYAVGRGKAKQGVPYKP